MLKWYFEFALECGNDGPVRWSLQGRLHWIKPDDDDDDDKTSMMMIMMMMMMMTMAMTKIAMRKADRSVGPCKVDTECWLFTGSNQLHMCYAALNPLLQICPQMTF